MTAIEAIRNVKSDIVIKTLFATMMDEVSVLMGEKRISDIEDIDYMERHGRAVDVVLGKELPEIVIETIKMLENFTLIMEDMEEAK